MLNIRRCCVLTTFALLCGVAPGQSRQVPAPPQDRPVIIDGATIHTMAGESIEAGVLVFEDGRITHVGTQVPPRLPDNALRIDGRGRHVYPGLIAAQTRLGLIETGAVEVTNDHDETGDVTPEVRAAVAINPDTDLIPVARANGILIAMTLPTGGTVLGRSAVIRMDGWTWEDMCIDAEAGLVVNWPRVQPRLAWWITESREEQMTSIREDLDRINKLFDIAEAYVAATDADDTLETDLRFEAMRPVLSGEEPLMVWASTAPQIESAVAWATARGYDLVIVGGYGADEAMETLVEHDVPVIINGTLRLPNRRHDAYDRPFRLPAILEEAGVEYCIAPGSSAGMERNLNHHAGMAVQHGLSRASALRAITINAARILGIDDMYGSLERDKSATLILTDGDPLEITTTVERAWIDGRDLDLSSRHTQMYEKFLEKYRQRGLLD